MVPGGSSAIWSPAERQAYASRSAGYRALGSIDLVERLDGEGRGLRLLQFRTFGGLSGEIAVDRCFDILALRYRDRNIGWHGPTQSRPAPDLFEDFSLGLLRSFDGFLVTCGLDHYGVPAAVSANHFIYPNRPRIDYPLHGRASAIPAQLESYGMNVDADEPFLWGEAIVRQAAVFGEVLELRRRIEIPLLGSQVRLNDIVTNRGARPSRHGVLYHVNIGYPLLDADTVLEGVDSAFSQEFSSTPPQASADTVERFDPVNPLAEADSDAAVTLNNRSAGMRFQLGFDRTTLPEFGVWRAYQAGIFALGLEPSSGLGGPGERYQPGHRDFLEPGQSRHYRLEFTAAPAD